MSEKPRNSRLIQFGDVRPPTEFIEWPKREPMPRVAKVILDGVREVEPIEIPGRDGWWHVAETRVSGGFGEPMARLEYSLVPAATGEDT